MLSVPFDHALVLTGPTGSGKSRLGLELAERLGAEIVSMDSMTVYRGMDIGTAKPSREDQSRVRHHLIDELDPWECASVAWWLRRAEECTLEIESRGKRVLFVGGTPLYLKALMHGLFEGPAAVPEIRLRLQAEAEALGPEALHARLANVDPAAAARLHPNDVRRVVRALEVFEVSGRPLSSQQTQWSSGAGVKLPAKEDFLVLWLNILRPELYQRIDARVVEMFELGLVDEVRRLCSMPRGLSREAGQALGYKEVILHLEGKATLAETITAVQTRTRQFAKRQITWFRHLSGCRAATRELTRALWEPTI
jgi:tRNA dimethylallyltransferase